MSMMMQQQAVAGTQAGGIGDPRAVSLDGVDQSVTLANLFAGRVTAGVADPFSWGISGNMPDVTSVKPMVGPAAVGGYDATATLVITGQSLRCFTQNSASTLAVETGPLGSVAANTTFRAGATWGTGTLPKIYLDGTVSTGGYSATTFPATPNDTTSVAIGRNGLSHVEGTFWAFWWTPVELTATQIAALDALIAAESYVDARDYLLAISADSVFIPVISTDDLTSGTGSVEDLLGNLDGTPINTVPADLVSIP